MFAKIVNSKILLEDGLMELFPSNTWLVVVLPDVPTNIVTIDATDQKCLRVTLRKYRVVLFFK